ncbi:hypothetical protein HCA61_00585 [Rhodococcus sp. HNM0563]|nr:hypothetical protein [Rhodococcus sp. HNM0563]NLU60762.1 hypothetical protein [Rhodococcus sp. HNM0563]
MDTNKTVPVTATAQNTAGTIRVRSTDEGLPIDLRIDPRELRFPAAQLAESIVALNRRAALEAAILRREQLSAQGVHGDVLDRMGMPTRADLPDIEHDHEGHVPHPPITHRPL